MNKKEYEMEKELIELKHKFNMEEIESEKQAKKYITQLIHENQMGLHRLKRADYRKSQEERRK